MNHVGDEGAGQLEVKVSDFFKDRDEVQMLDVLVVGESTVDEALLVEEGGSKAGGDELLPGLVFFIVKPFKEEPHPKHPEDGA